MEKTFKKVSKNIQELMYFHPKGLEYPEGGNYIAKGGHWAKCSKNAFIKTNQEKFEEDYLPKNIKVGIYDMTNCFHPNGVKLNFPGVYGLAAYVHTIKENIKAFVKTSERQDGMIVLPADFNDASVGLWLKSNWKAAENYIMGHGFKGKFEYRGQIYNEKSLTIEINGTDFKALETIALYIACSFNYISLVVKDFVSDNVFFIYGRYLCNDIGNFLKKNGIIPRQTTVVSS